MGVENCFQGRMFYQTDEKGGGNESDGVLSKEGGDIVKSDAVESTGEEPVDYDYDSFREKLLYQLKIAENATAPRGDWGVTRTGRVVRGEELGRLRKRC